MRIVADTNVFVSAVVFGGLPRRVLELAEIGSCELFYSKPIQIEVRRVLLEKFGWDAGRLDSALDHLWTIGKLVTTHRSVNAVRDDPDDNRILECAVAAQANFVVSGDQHLLRLGKFESVLIVSPREFLDLYQMER